MTNLTIYVISDSLGETANRAVRAALVQFPFREEASIQLFPYVDSKEELDRILKDAKKTGAILATTLIAEGLFQHCAEVAERENILHVDYLHPMLNAITKKTGESPINDIGALHTMNKSYFDRVDAIEFAVKYDDGKNPQGFIKSDIVILGISRTSKTPLSIYLAQKSYKVSNLPLIPEVPVPKEIYQLPKSKLVGLVASAEYIQGIRQERLRLMGLKGESSYSELNRIEEELAYSRDLFEALDALVINIEGKSVEETAQTIEETLFKDQDFQYHL